MDQPQIHKGTRQLCVLLPQPPYVYLCAQTFAASFLLRLPSWKYNSACLASCCSAKAYSISCLPALTWPTVAPYHAGCKRRQREVFAALPTKGRVAHLAGLLLTAGPLCASCSPTTPLSHVGRKAGLRGLACLCGPCSWCPLSFSCKSCKQLQNLKAHLGS